MVLEQNTIRVLDHGLVTDSMLTSNVWVTEDSVSGTPRFTATLRIVGSPMVSLALVTLEQDACRLHSFMRELEKAAYLQGVEDTKKKLRDALDISLK